MANPRTSIFSRAVVPALSFCVALGTVGCFGEDDASDLLDGLADAAGRGDAGGSADSGGSTLDVSIGTDSGADAGGSDTGSGGRDTGGGSDGIECVEIIECINDLDAPSTPAEEDAYQDEFLECVEAGSTEAQYAFEAILSCGQANCADAETDADFSNCLNSECAAEIADCTGEEPPPDPSGDATCTETVECFLTCRDQACANGCIGEAADEDAATSAIELYNCGVENCATARTAADFLACLESDCPDEFAACE